MQSNSYKPIKNQPSSLFKKCFKNPMFSLVPFEIWKDLIVSNADARSIAFLSQTCHAFKDIVDNIGANNFNLALLLRKEGQIILGRKYLFRCAENNNATAMFHLGYAFYDYGWGLEILLGYAKSAEWYKKSAELGNTHAMAFFADCLKHGVGVEKNTNLSNLWVQKALSSNNSFAVAYCHYFSVGVPTDYKKSFECFEASAKEGDEFGIVYLGECFFNEGGVKRDYKEALLWFLKAAERGSCAGQNMAALMYARGDGCEKDEKKAVFWFRKAAIQGNEDSKDELMRMGISF